jgi:hypothetical protein
VLLSGSQTGAEGGAEGSESRRSPDQLHLASPVLRLDCKTA